MPLAPHVEEILRQTNLPGLADVFEPGQFIMPHYGGYSIANLPATISALLGRELEGAAPALPEPIWRHMAGGARRVIMVILDAVGYQPFRRMVDENQTELGRIFRESTLIPLTSVYPSTTMTAMSSLWTGRTPGDHGFLGRRLFLAKLGLLADMVRLMPAALGRPGSLLDTGWRPEQFLRVPDLAQELKGQGVQTIAHLYASHTGGGLARLFLRSASSVRGFAGLSDMWINVRDSLLDRPGDPLYVNAYWYNSDDVAHRYGPSDERFRAAVRAIGRSFERDFLHDLPARAREGTVLMITADHGQIDTPPERAKRLCDHPELEQMLFMPPAAEPRASVLYVRRGHDEAVRAYVTEHMADRFVLLETDRAVEAGLFGPRELPVASRLRLGEMLLLARSDSQLIVGEGRTPHRGEHGSLRPEEMLVPLLMARLDR